MKKLCMILILAALGVSFAVNTASAADKTIYYLNAKALGMGNARMAGGFGYNGFLHNPALLARVDYFRLSIVPVPLMINGNLVDVAEFVNDNKDNFEDFDDLTVDEKNEFLGDLQEFDGQWGRVNLAPEVSLAISFLNQSIGLAVYNTTDVGFKIDRGVYEPRVWGEGYSNTVFALGYARPLTMLYPGLMVGVNLKMAERRRASLFQIRATDLGSADETLDPIVDEIQDDEQRTYMMDVGALWDIPILDMEVGATLSSLGDGRGASVDAGIAKRFLRDRLLILADVIDITDNNTENMFKKIHAGAQFKTGFLALRGGINSGYPTVGLGLNFKVIDIDAAWYWEELGNAPGVNEDERMLLHMKFGW